MSSIVEWMSMTRNSRSSSSRCSRGGLAAWSGLRCTHASHGPRGPWGHELEIGKASPHGSSHRTTLDCRVPSCTRDDSASLFFSFSHIILMGLAACACLPCYLHLGSSVSTGPGRIEASTRDWALLHKRPVRGAIGETLASSGGWKGHTFAELR